MWYRVTVGGENVGVCVETLQEAKAWAEEKNGAWDCVVWVGRGCNQSIAAVYRGGKWLDLS